MSEGSSNRLTTFKWTIRIRPQPGGHLVPPVALSTSKEFLSRQETRCLQCWKSLKTISSAVFGGVDFDVRVRPIHLLPCGICAIPHQVSLVKVFVDLSRAHFRLPRQLHLRPLVYIAFLHNTPRYRALFLLAYATERSFVSFSRSFLDVLARLRLNRSTVSSLHPLIPLSPPYPYYPSTPRLRSTKFLHGTLFFGT